MTTSQQLAAAKAFLTACGPANALAQRTSTQSQKVWQGELKAAQADRFAARTALQDLCETHEAYQAAIAAAHESRKIV